MKIIKMGNPTGESVSIIFECSKCGCVYEVEFEKAERLEHWRAGVSYNRSCPMCGKSNSRTRKAVEAEFGLFEWHLSNVEVPFLGAGREPHTVRFRAGKWASGGALTEQPATGLTALRRLQPVQLDENGTNALALAAEVSELRQKLEASEARAEKAERERDGFKQRYIEMTNRACELSKIVEEHSLEE